MMALSAQSFGLCRKFSCGDDLRGVDPGGGCLGGLVYPQIVSTDVDVLRLLATFVTMVHRHSRRLGYGVPEGLNGLCHGRLVTGLSRHHRRPSQQRQRHDDRGPHKCSPCNLLLWARVLRRLDGAACGEADRSCILYHTENQSGGWRCRHGVKLGVYTAFVQVVSRTYYTYNPSGA